MKPIDTPIQHLSMEEVLLEGARYHDTVRLYTTGTPDGLKAAVYHGVLSDTLRRMATKLHLENEKKNERSDKI